MVQKSSSSQNTENLEFKQVQLKKTSAYIPQKMYEDTPSSSSSSSVSSQDVDRSVPSKSRAPPPKLCGLCQAIITSNFCTQCGTKAGAPLSTPSTTITSESTTAKQPTKTGKKFFFSS